MSLVIVKTTAEQPLTDEILQDAHERISPCLEMRNITWLYSLLSSDRHHLICTLDAPDAGSVRDAYHKGGLTSSRVWSGLMIQPEDNPPQRNPSLLKVIEGTYPPLSEDDWQDASSATLRCYAEHGIEWIRSFLSLDRTRVICELNAPDLESVCRVQHRLKIPFDRVWSAQVLSP